MNTEPVRTRLPVVAGLSVLGLVMIAFGALAVPRQRPARSRP